MQLDMQAPGVSQLRLRLQPCASAAEIVDADSGATEKQPLRGKPKHFGSGELVLSLDYENEPDWNHTLWLNSAGVIASSDDRKKLLADLEVNIPARPSTTRYVVAAHLLVEGEPQLTLFDTLGLEDGIGLYEVLA